MADPYQVLGVSPSASDEEIKKAYRNLSRKYHPDANINNPNRAQAEEKFKEVQQAYDQIMKEKQQGGGYSGYGGYGTGSYGGRANSYGYYGGAGASQRREESPQMRAAANYISNRHFAEALNVLNNIPFGERQASWYYYSAHANRGIGNNIQALEHAKRAVEMEPNNMEYRIFLQQLEGGNTWYTNMGSGYGRPYESAGNWCLSMVLLNMFCNCCCRPF